MALKCAKCLWHHSSQRRGGCKTMQQWWLYMLECADRSLYTGISTEPARRVHEHNTSLKGARYTRARRPVRPVLLLPAGDRASASQLEARIKRLSRRDKQLLLVALEMEKRQRPLSLWIESLTESVRHLE